LIGYTAITCDDNIVLLGIPAREMPFVMPDNSLLENDLSVSKDPSVYPLLLTCFSFFMGKCLFIALYSSFSIITAMFIHAILGCAVDRYSMSLLKKRAHFTYPETTKHMYQFFADLIKDVRVFVESYLSGAQFLIFYFRALGAQIGCDVILTDRQCLADHHLLTIGDHVRLSTGASIQVSHYFVEFIFIHLLLLFYFKGHTFERRSFKLAPVTVNHSSILMSNALILAGSTLQGQNRILPLTRVMKNDQLPPNTNWSGVPAQQTV
jgi:hypothetical protein